MKSLHTTIEGINIVILTRDGKVDVVALEKIKRFLQKQKETNVSN